MLNLQPSASTSLPSGLPSGHPDWRSIAPRLTRQEHEAPADARGDARADVTAGQFLALMIDEVDYGMVLVSGNGHVLHLNHAARLEVDNGQALKLSAGALFAHRNEDDAAFHNALHDAHARQRRCLLTLGHAEHAINVAVVPLDARHGRSATLLMLSKPRVCEALSLQYFASNHGLTQAEGQVLNALCTGLSPTDIAHKHGVAISTVRTQIHHIRSKTGASGIAALVRQIARLPPLLSALRLSRI